MWQGAPWCFTNNAWTLSTEYLIEWGARWGPYMKKEPYRYPTCHAALYTVHLLPDAQLRAALCFWFVHLPSTFLSFGFYPCPVAFWLVPLPSAFLSFGLCLCPPFLPLGSCPCP